MFDAKPKVRDAAGGVPLNYQPDLLDPLGRTVDDHDPQAVLAAAGSFRRDRGEREARRAAGPFRAVA